ncbi:Phosphatidylinositol-binding clathrin assembly protein, partial [Paragonimus heterotremus]
RFSQFIASNNCHFYLPSLTDRNSFQAHGIAAFIRPYAKYLDEKAASYREIAFDLCRLKLGKEDGSIRTMPQTKLFKTLPVIENQIDALLAFDATSNELVNTVLRVAHLHLYRDLIRLYAVYNEAMINLIGRYFTMSKRDCRTSLNCYKSFLKRMESMNAFVKVAESADTSGLPSSHENDCITFQPVPSSVLEALEQHLTNLESHKQIDTNPFSSRLPVEKSADLSTPQFSSPESGHKNADGAPMITTDVSQKLTLTDAERKRIIEEERARLEMFVSSARKHTFSNSEVEMRATEDQLRQFNSDAEFADLLSVSPDTSVQKDDLPKFVSSSGTTCPSAWSVPNKTDAPVVSENAVRSTTGQELVLLDLNESSTSDPFSSDQKPTNLRTPSLPTVSASPNCLSWNPFLPTNSNTPVSVSNGLATAVNTWNSRTSQYTPFGPPNTNGRASSSFQSVYLFPPMMPVISLVAYVTFQLALENMFGFLDYDVEDVYTIANHPEPNTDVPREVNDPASATLDARLAQIAGNLTIGTEVRSPSGVYRAPDGSLTSVNWTGTLQPIPVGPDPTRPSQIRSSVSMNQLTGHVFPPATSATNPWQYPMPNTYRPAYVTGPAYNMATYSSSASAWMSPSFQPSTTQAHPISASVTGSANVVRSTNPFL